MGWLQLGVVVLAEMELELGAIGEAQRAAWALMNGHGQLLD
jgi:hypothetical protein